MTKKANEIVQLVTNQIIKDMESADGSKWIKGWSNKSFQNINGHHYTGFNVFWLSMIDGGFLGGEARQRKVYGTYLQWKNIGCQVKKGSKSIQLLKPIIGVKKVEDKDGKEVDRPYKFFSTFNVFNIEDVDGDISSFDGVDRPRELNDVEASKVADNYVSYLNADIEHIDGGNAYYVPSQDKVFMPSRSDFINTKDGSATHNYYGTLFHELTHWTGHSTRCDRKLTGYKGSKDYAFEELVAELGSAFLCNQLDISASPRHDHAKYLKSWIRCLKDNPNALLNASGLASKSLKYMNELQPEFLAPKKVVLKDYKKPELKDVA